MAMNSVLSFPERGPWGDSRYRGNCSGHVVRETLYHFRPALFVDVAEGGGTSRQVAEEIQRKGDFPLEYVGLDLRYGQSVLHPITGHLPRRANHIFFHPPYWNIIPYSGPKGMWGRDGAPHPEDLSRDMPYEEFLYLMQQAGTNIYEGVERGGYYSILIGDIRKGGQYYFVSSDLTQILPGKLDSVQIKVQHNCVSDARRYNGEGRLIRIMHEYLLHFRRDDLFFGMLDATLKASRQLKRLSHALWNSLITTALKRLGGRGALADIYRVIEEMAPEETRERKRENWQAKIRQLLQFGDFYQPLDRGVWSLAGMAAAA